MSRRRGRSAAWRWLEASQDDRDAAQRMADGMQLHLSADPVGAIGKWCAFRLSDGRSDGVAYDPAPPPGDPRRFAIDHQLHESQCCYLVVTPDGLRAEDALIFLQTARELYRRGMRFTDPPPPSAMPARMGRSVLHNRNNFN